MKKKLLLSSVAALTLFAAYNVANADDVTYGKFGEPLYSEKKLPDAYSIEKAETPADLAKAAEKYEARQAKAVALRKANTKLTSAKEDEANAKTVFEKAQKAYDEAVQKVTDAVNTQYDASVQKDKLTAVLATIEARLTHDEAALPENEQALTLAKTKQDAAAKALAKAEADVTAHRDAKPVAGAPLDVLKEYELKHIDLERALEKAKDAKVLVDKAVEKLVKDVKDLKESIENGKDRKASLTKAIEQLAVVVGNEDENQPNTGKVRGVLVEELQKESDLRYYELGQASTQRIWATSLRKEAQEEYDEALKAAQDLYKEQGVDFVLADVLAVEKPSETYVTKFGWNQDKAGNWVYLKDSEGTKATGWVNDNGSWYYLGQDGVMKKWWVQVEGTWYYLNGSGAMQTGWLQDNGTWYYLEASGAMKANQWFEVGGKWYHVDASGALSVNTTVDGYNVNENGEWV